MVVRTIEQFVVDVLYMGPSPSIEDTTCLVTFQREKMSSAATSTMHQGYRAACVLASISE